MPLDPSAPHGDGAPPPAGTPATRRHLVTSDGVSLAVFDRGRPDAPLVVAVHGYPDDHRVWDRIAAELGIDHRIVTYDVRGAGSSSAPDTRAGYRLDRLADDLVAVLDTVAPGGTAHLLGHDWGAVQTWHAVTDTRLAGRFASFTSISGPCLHHVDPWFRRRTPGARPEILRQALASWYTLAFRAPLLPELAWRSHRFRERVAREQAIPVPVVRTAVHGLELYRANLGRSDAQERHTDVPVQVLAPTGDRFVTPALARSAEPFASDLRVHELPGGHWIVRRDPAVVADLVRGFVGEVDGGSRG